MLLKFASKNMLTIDALYPLKFAPIFKSKIWGGKKIKSLLGIDFGTLPNCGEAWVLSGVSGDESVVANGLLKNYSLPQLIDYFQGALVGERVYSVFGNEFPILVKLIDSTDKLSVQVHPDDQIALAKYGQRGKTEMWYVLHADQDAELINGFCKPVKPQEFKNLLNGPALSSVLHAEKVKKDDAFFIPAGRVHAIGSGILLAEIQQTSDITFRIYDWDRCDEQGKPRDLHIQEANDCINFVTNDAGKVKPVMYSDSVTNLVSCPHFVTNLIECEKKIDRVYELLDSFKIFVCTEGAVTLVTGNHTMQINMGECVLVPAIIEQIRIIPQGYCKVLEVYMDSDMSHNNNN